MVIHYQTRKLEKALTNPKELSKHYGKLAKKISQRLAELRAADTLAVMATLPQARCHELKGDRQGQFAVDVSGNYRLIFAPDHDPVPTKDDGGLDWSSITIISIQEIDDYH